MVAPRSIHVIARSEATKQSILSLRGTMDCFASLAMTALRHAFLLSRHHLPEVLQEHRPPVIQRAQGRPGARCTRGLMRNSCNKNARMSIQEQRRTPGLPCAMALRLIRGRPGDRLCLSPLKRRQHRDVRPSRLRRTLQSARLTNCCVHRSLPLVCDDGQRPSDGTGWR